MTRLFTLFTLFTLSAVIALPGLSSAQYRNIPNFKQTKTIHNAAWSKKKLRAPHKIRKSQLDKRPFWKLTNRQQKVRYRPKLRFFSVYFTQSVHDYFSERATVIAELFKIFMREKKIRQKKAELMKPPSTEEALEGARAIGTHKGKVPLFAGAPLTSRIPRAKRGSLRAAFPLPRP